MKGRSTALALLIVSLAIFGIVSLNAVASSSRETAQYVAKALGLGKRRAATRLFNGSIPKSWIEAAGGTKPPKYLQWPVPGHDLRRGFGSNEGKHMAVDIDADVGTRVRAMAPGIICYADDTVRGYGKMVMMIHAGGWVTLYAHLDDYLAVPGQWVARRQPIALSGNTGIVKHPHLHIALIIRGKPVDPMRYMRGFPELQHRISQLGPNVPIWHRSPAG